MKFYLMLENGETIVKDALRWVSVNRLIGKDNF